MTEGEALELFQTHLPWFRGCWEQGWADYRRTSHPMDDPRARAVMIQNRATIHARNTFNKQDGISYKEFNSRHLFLFSDWAVVQFKKLHENPKNGELVLSNNLNETARAFDAQRPLEGLITAPRITVGYHPNEFHTDFSVYLVHTKTHFENNWISDITAAPVAITPYLFEDLDEQLYPQTKRVRPRARGAEHSGDVQAAQG